MKPIALSNTQPQRLDVCVSAFLGISRTKVQNAIKTGDVLVNGQKATPHLLVNASDAITYNPTVFSSRQKSTDTPPVLDILYEDDDVLVINKPAGLIVHDTQTNTEPTLVDALITYCPTIAKVGDSVERAGLVHRLDKAASGILIVAKTQMAFEYIKEQFRNRAVQKMYSVLVRGSTPHDVDTIDFPIERSKSSGRMAARPTSQAGKSAVTHYEVIKRYPHHTLLNIKIDTGRTHQIRAHMFALQCPVVGDTLYRQKGIKPEPIGRIFLHARELTITLPSGNTKTFIAPLPAELEEVLKKIPKI